MKIRLSCLKNGLALVLCSLTYLYYSTYFELLSCSIWIEFDRCSICLQFSTSFRWLFGSIGFEESGDWRAIGWRRGNEWWTSSGAAGGGGGRRREGGGGVSQQLAVTPPSALHRQPTNRHAAVDTIPHRSHPLVHPSVSLTHPSVIVASICRRIHLSPSTHVSVFVHPFQSSLPFDCRRCCCCCCPALRPPSVRPRAVLPLPPPCLASSSLLPPSEASESPDSSRSHTQHSEQGNTTTNERTDWTAGEPQSRSRRADICLCSPSLSVCIDLFFRVRICCCVQVYDRDTLDHSVKVVSKSGTAEGVTFEPSIIYAPKAQPRGQLKTSFVNTSQYLKGLTVEATVHTDAGKASTVVVSEQMMRTTIRTTRVGLASRFCIFVVRVLKSLSSICPFFV